MEQIEGKTVSDERKPVDALSAFSTLEGIVEDIVDLDADAYIELPNELLIRLMYARGTIHNVHAAVAELIEAADQTIGEFDIWDDDLEEETSEASISRNTAVRASRRLKEALAACRGGVK